jgi:S1-C subfamily serine protease
MALVLEGLSAGWSEAADQVRPSVVQILSQGRGIGAGTIWHARGLILTNAHVACAEGLAIRCLDGAECEAHTLALDERLDLAVLSVEGDGLPAVDLGRSSQLRNGEMVLAMGHPWGVAHAATLGNVIEVGQSPAALPGSGGEWIAIDLHLRPGHSGGALIDGRGRLVGITTIMAGPDVGLAIPVDVARRFLRAARIGPAIARPRRAA